MTNSNYETTDNGGETVCTWLERNGHLYTVLVLSKGLNAKVNAKNEENDPLNEAEMLSWNVVMTLAVEGKTNAEHLRVLVEDLKIDINARDEYGRTACMLAAIYGNTETMFDLVRLGADISIKDNDACSVFDHISVRNFCINRPDGEDIETKKKIIELRKEYEDNHPDKPKMADDLAKIYLPEVAVKPVDTPQNGQKAREKGVAADRKNRINS